MKNKNIARYRRVVTKINKLEKEFEKLKEYDVEILTQYVMEMRYPRFYEPEKEEVREAIEIAEAVKNLSFPVVCKTPCESEGIRKGRRVGKLLIC